MQALERERLALEDRLSTASLPPADLADAGRRLATRRQGVAVAPPLADAYPGSD